MAGETSIPSLPKKIAVLDYRLADSLLALGIKPYAMTSYLGETDLPYLEGKPLEGVINLGDTPNLEAVLQASPDLIIGRKPEEKIYEQLQKIAPTILLDIPDKWRDGLKELGAILGKEKEAGAWLKQYEQKAADARKAIEPRIDPNETFLYLRILPKEIRLYGTTELFGSTMFQDLKLKPVPQAAEVKRMEAIPLEKLVEMNPDRMFVQIGLPVKDGDKQAQAKFDELSQSALWNNIKAVKYKRVYVVPHWVISDYPFIHSRSIDLIREAIVGKP